MDLLCEMIGANPELPGAAAGWKPQRRKAFESAKATLLSMSTSDLEGRPNDDTASLEGDVDWKPAASKDPKGYGVV